MDPRREPAAPAHRGLLDAHDRARPWRLAFVLYALALATGTHWPKLELHLGDRPAPDKLIHLVAFGGLAVLLWQTRWVSGLGRLALIGLAWSAVDETTQAIPGLGRHLSWLDMIAGQIGIVLVAAWGWALEPQGGAASRARQAFASLALDHLFLRARNWLLIGAGAAAGAVIIGAAAVTLAMMGFRVDRFHAAMMGLVAGAAGGAHVTLESCWRRERARLAPLRPCLACGASCAGAAWNAQAASQCARCSAPIWAGTWSEPVWPPRPDLARLALKPALAALAIVLGASAMFLLIINLRLAVPLAGRAFRAYAGLPTDMVMVIDLAVLALALAVAVRLYRGRIASLIDRQHLRCLRCGHDLRGTPQSATGTGACGECGTEFVSPPTASGPTPV
jgi:hypothetical protein